MKSFIFLSFLGCLVSASPLASSATSSTIATTSSCRPTATPIASLCDYPGPPDPWINAVATDGPEFCWQACWDHPTCNFVIYRKAYDEIPGIKGPGNCWLYPNIKYAPTKGKECTKDKTPKIFVYNTPTCKPLCYPTADTLIDNICGYGEPEKKENIIVAKGPETCWKACGDDQDCDFVIFTKGRTILGVEEPSYCWIYQSDVYIHERATGCAGSRSPPPMFVYNKQCDKKTA
ncbi:hypothetical protein TWF694_005999 [Orbilia ellipsospora]|uniref:Apple domain-containing protein n=1 Tax=Orbilia ellipsospora TaxID=2528407 RepID=A0AAV9WR13_9PEZI